MRYIPSIAFEEMSGCAKGVTAANTRGRCTFRIPTKKVHNVTYYSKVHFDMSRGIKPAVDFAEARDTRGSAGSVALMRLAR